MEETRRSLWQALVACHTGRPEDQRNNWIATGWLLVWMVTYAVATWLLRNPPVAKRVNE